MQHNRAYVKLHTNLSYNSIIPFILHNQNKCDENR